MEEGRPDEYFSKETLSDLVWELSVLGGGLPKKPALAISLCVLPSRLPMSARYIAPIRATVPNMRELSRFTSFELPGDAGRPAE